MNGDIICITCFFNNYERYIENGMNNFLKQDCPNLKIIVLCGLSTDSTIDTLRDYENKHSNISVIEIDSMPAIKDYINILNEFKGDFVYFCDADDVLPENALSRLYEHQKKTGADMVYGRTWHRNVDNEIYTPESHKYRVESIWKQRDIVSLKSQQEIVRFALNAFHFSGEPSFTSCWGHLFKRDIFIDAAQELIARQKLRDTTDSDFAISLLRKYKHVELLNEPLYYYMVHSNQSATNYCAYFLFDDNYIDVLKNYHEQISKLMTDCLGCSSEEAHAFASRITSRQFLGYYIYNYRLANIPNEAMLKRTKELVDNPFIAEILQYHHALPGDSRMIPFCLRKRLFKTAAWLCRRKAQKRYSKSK